VEFLISTTKCRAAGVLGGCENVEFVSSEMVRSDLLRGGFTHKKGTRRGIFSEVKCYIFNTYICMDEWMKE
jgi:hypothetical protein